MGPLSDRLGRGPIILGSMVAFIVLTAATSVVDSAAGFIRMRVATAVGASGVVPIALALIGDLFPFHQRERALGWLFGGMAGEIAGGSTAGALAESPSAGRGCFSPSRPAACCSCCCCSGPGRR
ncbi:MFS transporter [Lapillicoccus sp.]|uniref:MFS transporter n=1 Tax=Lapillicoccus sp. TaxID=1909287 RepID=UPI003983A5A5